MEDTTMSKQKKPPATRLGRPPIYGERVAWLVHLPVALADLVDKWRKKRRLSRAAAIAEVLEEHTR